MCRPGGLWTRSGSKLAGPCCSQTVDGGLMCKPMSDVPAAFQWRRVSKNTERLHCLNQDVTAFCPNERAALSSYPLPTVGSCCHASRWCLPQWCEHFLSVHYICFLHASSKHHRAAAGRTHAPRTAHKNPVSTRAVPARSFSPLGRSPLQRSQLRLSPLNAVSPSSGRSPHEV